MVWVVPPSSPYPRPCLDEGRLIDSDIIAMCFIDAGDEELVKLTLSETHRLHSWDGLRLVVVDACPVSGCPLPQCPWLPNPLIPLPRRVYTVTSAQ